MKQFIAFVKKEFFHIFRDRRTMLILLGMPVVQIILFGFAITTEVKNVRVGVLDPSNDIVTRKIIDRLDASEYFSVKCLLHSPQEMERVFQENEIDMALVFSEQFADRLYTGDARVQVVSDATDPNMATTQAGYATGVIAAVRQEMLPPGMSVPSVVPNVKLLYNPSDEECLQFCTRCDGAYLDVDLCHDDLYLYCPGEGNRHDGDPVGISGETAVYYSGQGSSLFCIVICQSYDDSVAFCLCARCACGRQPVLADYGVVAFHFCIVVAGITYLYGDTDTGSCHAGLGFGTDDAYHVAFGYDISDRKYAFGAAINF